MSGHNKWSTIKHKKAKTDAQKGKVFSKLAREIWMAAKSGGGDPGMNAGLRLAIQKAKDMNMPNDNIKRAIDKAAGAGEGTNLEEVVYEAYGPHGVALMIHVLTDNKNRTVSNIRSILTKAGGSIAEKGSVSYLFEKKGLISFDAGVAEDRLIGVATGAGADDIDVQEDGSIEVITRPVDFEDVRQACEEAGLTYISASMSMVPTTTVDLDEQASESILNLMTNLENDDDVQDVYANYTVSDDIMAKFLAK